MFMLNFPNASPAVKNGIMRMKSVIYFCDFSLKNYLILYVKQNKSEAEF